MCSLFDSAYRFSHRYAGEEFAVYCGVMLHLRDLQLLVRLVSLVKSEKFVLADKLNGSC